MGATFVFRSGLRSEDSETISDDFSCGACNFMSEGGSASCRSARRISPAPGREIRVGLPMERNELTAERRGIDACVVKRRTQAWRARR